MAKKAGKKSSGAEGSRKKASRMALQKGKVRKKSKEHRYHLRVRSALRNAMESKLRVRGRDAQARGDVVTMEVPATYRADYTPTDLVRACRALERGDITVQEMWRMEKGRKGHAPGSWKEKYKVPAQTVANYMKLDPATRKPRWHAVEATNTFTKTGKPPTLGAAEEVLGAAVVIAHRQGMPFTRADVIACARSVAMKLKATDPLGKPYSETTDMRMWYDAFVERCKSEHGIDVHERRGHAMSNIRDMCVSKESVIYYRDHVHNPTMNMVRERHTANGTKLTFNHKGNFDEFQLDLNAFASKESAFLVVANEEVNVRVPFERCPHITVVCSFLGRKPLMHLLVLPRENLPHEFASMLQRDDLVGITGTDTGWISGDTKTSWFKKVTEDPTNIIGKEPVLMTFDGHYTNVCNLELATLMIGVSVVGLAGPAHHTHVLQECDTSTRNGGPIARVKATLSDKLRRHIGSKIIECGECNITMPQLARLLEMSIEEALTPEVCIAAMQAVGYYEDDNGELQYDPIAVVDARLIPSRKDITSTDGCAPGATRSGFRRPIPSPLRQLSASASGALALTAAQEAIGERFVSQVDDDPNKGKRRKGGRSYNQRGCVITNPDHIQMLEAERNSAQLTEMKKTHKVWEDQAKKLKKAVAVTARQLHAAIKSVETARTRAGVVAQVLALSGEANVGDDAWWKSRRRGGLTAAMAKATINVLDGKTPSTITDALREQIASAVANGSAKAAAERHKKAASDASSVAAHEAASAQATWDDWLRSHPEPPKPPSEEESDDEFAFVDAEEDDGGDAAHVAPTDVAGGEDDDANAAPSLPEHVAGEDDANAALRTPTRAAPSRSHRAASLSTIKKLTPSSRARAITSLSPRDQQNVLLALFEAAG